MGGGQLMAVATTQRDQLRRLSLLVPYILTHQGVRLRDLAAEFGTTVRRIRADLDTLWFCGLPGQGMGELIEIAYEGDQVWVTFDAGIDRPLQLTREEATALVVALRFLAANPDLVDQEAVVGALDKIEQAVGERAAGSAAIAVTATPAPRIASTVREALEGGRALRIEYFVPSRDEKTTRIVDPVRLLRVEDQDYLEAWCRRAEGMRTFRLDRIDGAEILAEPSAPPDLPQRDLAGGIFVPDPDARIITLHLGIDGRWVQEYYDLIEQTPLPDGTTRVRMPITDDDTLTRLLIQLGPDGIASFDDPYVAAVAARIAGRSAAALDRYGDGPQE